MRGRTLFACALVALIGCGPPDRNSGGGGDDDDGTDPDGANANEDCADGTELIYTIDQFNRRLSQFDPMTKTFFDLGSINCPVNGSATPFSMSVDRQANAWVLFTNGEMFWVSITNGLSCQKVQWTAPAGLTVFGMGFSTDQPGGSTEALYIGGGTTQMQSSYTLARVDPITMTSMPIGNQPALPEMTGNGNAELWGFMPETSNARVVQFDKTNGTIVKEFSQPMLAGTMSGYAFAHWGGDYWVFLQKAGETSTKVYQIDGMAGGIKTITPTTSRTIVGAGVSTCAPVVIL
jgi:hypothetical protein